MYDDDEDEYDLRRPQDIREENTKKTIVQVLVVFVAIIVIWLNAKNIFLLCGGVIYRNIKGATIEEEYEYKKVYIEHQQDYTLFHHQKGYYRYEDCEYGGFTRCRPFTLPNQYMISHEPVSKRELNDFLSDSKGRTIQEKNERVNNDCMFDLLLSVIYMSTAIGLIFKARDKDEIWEWFLEP